MKRDTQKTNSNKPSIRLIKNILRSALTIVVFAGIFAFQTNGFADDTKNAKSGTDAQYLINLTEAPPKLPARWVWEKKTVNFDHMYRKAR